MNLCKYKRLVEKKELPTIVITAEALDDTLKLYARRMLGSIYFNARIEVDDTYNFDIITGRHFEIRYEKNGVKRFIINMCHVMKGRNIIIDKSVNDHYKVIVKYFPHETRLTAHHIDVLKFGYVQVIRDKIIIEAKTMGLILFESNFLYGGLSKICENFACMHVDDANFIIDSSDRLSMTTKYIELEAKRRSEALAGGLFMLLHRRCALKDHRMTSFDDSA